MLRQDHCKDKVLTNTPLTHAVQVRKEALERDTNSARQLVKSKTAQRKLRKIAKPCTSAKAANAYSESVSLAHLALD